MPITDTRKIRTLLDSRHPEWVENVNLWRFYQMMYRGGKHVVNDTVLNRFQRESDDAFKFRVTHCYYPNILHSIVNLATDFVFRDDLIERENNIDPFLHNVDLIGTPIDDFISCVVREATMLGLSYTLVDQPKFDDSIRSKLDLKQISPPYFIHIPRIHMLNWEINMITGEPYWILFSQPAEPDSTDPFRISGSNKQYYKLITRTEWVLYSAESASKQDVNPFFVNPSNQVTSQHSYLNQSTKVKVEDWGVNELGFIPIATVYGEKQGLWSGESNYADLAFVAKELINMCSLRSYTLFQSGFAQLAVQGTPEDVRDLDASPSKIMCYPDGKNPPVWISPDSSSMVPVSNQIDDLIQLLYMLTHQRLINASASYDGASGISKQEDFQSTSTFLAKLSKKCQQFENRLHSLRSEFLGEKPMDSYVKYPTAKSFSLDAVDDAIKRALMIDQVSGPQALKDLMLQNLFDQLYTPNDDKGLRKQFSDQLRQMSEAKNKNIMTGLAQAQQAQAQAPSEQDILSNPSDNKPTDFSKGPERRMASE